MASKKSFIWDCFEILPNDHSKAKCSLCEKILSRGGTEKHKMTTTNLRNHLKNAHKEVYKKFNQDTDTENS